MMRRVFSSRKDSRGVRAIFNLQDKESNCYVLETNLQIVECQRRTPVIDQGCPQSAEGRPELPPAGGNRVQGLAALADSNRPGVVTCGPDGLAAKEGEGRASMRLYPAP